MSYNADKNWLMIVEKNLTEAYLSIYDLNNNFTNITITTIDGDHIYNA